VPLFRDKPAVFWIQNSVADDHDEPMGYLRRSKPAAVWAMMTNVLGLTNAFHALYTSAAYKAVALQLMLGEANHFAEALKLPAPLPIGISQLADAYVSPPKFGLGGSLQTTNFAFTFHEGRLHSIVRLDVLHGPEPLRDIFDRLSQQATLVDSNGAYRLATQWLSAASVDVETMVRKYPKEISQRRYAANAPREDRTLPKSGKDKPLPIYDVKWRDSSRPEYIAGAIKVSILAASNQLLALEIGDFSFSIRPPVVVTNAAELNMIDAPPQLLALATRPDTNQSSPWKRPRWSPPADLPENERAVWLETFFGGKEVIDAIQNPVRVNVYRLKPSDEMNVTNVDAYAVKKGPLRLDKKKSQAVAKMLLDFNSYRWDVTPFHPQYVARFEFIGKSSKADFVISKIESTVRLYTPNRRTPEISADPVAGKIDSILRF